MTNLIVPGGIFRKFDEFRDRHEPCPIQVALFKDIGDYRLFFAADAITDTANIWVVFFDAVLADIAHFPNINSNNMLGLIDWSL